MTSPDDLASTLPEHVLAVYGSLAPGRVNHHQLAGLEGSWRTDLWVTGRLEDRGWGAGLGYPALVWVEDGPRVPVQLFVSHDLPTHWERLDAFEGRDYVRVVVPVHGESGVVAMANVYAARTPTHEEAGAPQDFASLPLHDAVLREIRVAWEARTCAIRLAAFVRPSQRAVPHLLTFTGVTSVVVPSEAPWGPSVFVNEARRGADGAYQLQIQSGDLVEIRAEGFTFVEDEA